MFVKAHTVFVILKNVRGQLVFLWNENGVQGTKPQFHLWE
jgi:hypothetical protein